MISLLSGKPQKKVSDVQKNALLNRIKLFVGLQLMKLALFILLALIALLCNASIIAASNSSSPSDASSSNTMISSIIFYDIPLNLSSLNTTTQTELNACFVAINDSNVVNGVPDLAAAFLRAYSDGRKEYYLYLDTVDQQQNIHEYEGAVSVENSDTVYRIISIQEIPIDLSGNSNLSAASAPINLIKPPSSNSASSPSNLASFISGYASDFTLLTSSQIYTDSNLPNIQKAILNDFPVVSGASVAAIYSKTQGLSTSYLVFYSKSSNNSINLWSSLAVADSIKKAVYILTFNSIPVPSSIKN